jgi:hypothetical protein
MFNYQNVFTIIVPFSEHRTGKAWEFCNKPLLILPPELKCFIMFHFPAFSLLSIFEGLKDLQVLSS